MSRHRNLLNHPTVGPLSHPIDGVTDDLTEEGEVVEEEVVSELLTGPLSVRHWQSTLFLSLLSTTNQIRLAT